jgi:hypothetical protein
VNAGDADHGLGCGMVCHGCLDASEARKFNAAGPPVAPPHNVD